MELVRIIGASKRTRQPRSLTAQEFRQFAAQLHEPFRTIAVLCVCLGLRISEALALQWSDVNWLEGKLAVTKAIVRQRLANTKTEGSRKPVSLDTSLIAVLESWRQLTQFGDERDFIFASPCQLGALPWSYPWVWNVFQKAAYKAGIGKLATHTMRHTYRSWLDATGTSLAVQQKLMRHSDIRTTLNIYGDVITAEMAEANTKVATMALPNRLK
jgi:integrase